MPLPGQSGRDVRLAQGDRRRREAAVARRERLVVGTANITAAASVERLDNLEVADVWLLQEVKLQLEEEIASFQVNAEERI